MNIFICNYCNNKIHSRKNIYYAYDYKYCSSLCRLKYLREKDYNNNKNVIIKQDNINKQIEEKKLYNITSLKSVENLSDCHDDNDIKEKKPRICSTYLEYTLELTFNLFIYIMNNVYTSPH